MTHKLSQFALVGMLGVLLVGLMVSGATADHEQVHCNGCVDKTDIAGDAVTSAEIADDGVAKPDIRKDSVTSVEISDNGVAKPDIRGGAVTSAEIANGSIRPGDMAPYAKIQAWADTVETNNVDGSTTGLVEVNSLDIDPPTDGFLIISGTVVVNNNDSSVGTFSTGVRIDGANLPGQDGSQANREIDGEGGADDVSVGFTLMVPVSAGNYTLTQVINGGTTSWNYRDPNLTVQFIPGPLGSMSPTSSTTSSAATAGTLSSNDGDS